MEKLLYKYRNFSNKLYIRLLSHNEIFFSSPQDFNDPFDCKIHISYHKNISTEEQFIEYWVSKMDSPDHRDKALELLGDLRIETMRNHLRSRYKELMKQYGILENADIQQGGDYTSTWGGVYSLSERRDSILMWSHYANCHKGYCVGLNAEKLFREISSNKNPPIMDNVHYGPYPDINPDDSDFYEKLPLVFLAKHTDWSYEKEVRLLWEKNIKRVLVIRDDIIEEIVVGMNISTRNLNVIKKILLERRYKPNLYRANREPGTFRLRFDSIEY